MFRWGINPHQNIKPTGEITFRRSDLKPLWQCRGDTCVAPTTIADLVTTSREAIGVRSLGAIHRPDVPKTQNQLKRLHELLIKPISDLLPTQESDKVIFIPQSSLFLVPFTKGGTGGLGFPNSPTVSFRVTLRVT